MKKFLSIILAVVMIASLLPATFMTASAAEPTELNYVFNPTAISANAGISTDSNIPLANIGFDDIDTTVSSGTWGNKNHRPTDHVAGFSVGALTVSVNPDYPLIDISLYAKQVSDSEYMFYDYETTGSGGVAPIAMIALNVPTAGTYIPSLTAQKNGNGQKFEVFLVNHEDVVGLTPTEVRESLNVADRIGVYDSSVGGTQTFIEHYLPKGVYYLTLIPGGKGTKETATSGNIPIQPKSFKLAVPEKLAEDYDPSKLHDKDGEKYAHYEFMPQAFNIANPVINSSTGETDWYFGDTYENMLAWADAAGFKTSNSSGYENLTKVDNYRKNTWTDQSEEAKTVGKYIPWLPYGYSESNFGSANRITYAWFRNNQSTTVYLYDTGHLWKDNYDYINTAYTDPWAWVSKSGTHASATPYVSADSDTRTNGLRTEFATANLKELGTGNTCVVLKVKVPTAAKYTATINHQTIGYNGASAPTHLFAAYMLPASETLPTTYAERAPYYVLGGRFSDGTSSKTGTLNALTAGDYYLIIEYYRDANTTEATTYTSDILGLTLTAQGEPEVPVEPEVAEKRAAMVLDEGNPEAEARSDGAAATINVLARETSEDGDAIVSEATPNGLIVDPITTVAGQEVTTVEAPEIPGYTFRYWGTGLGTKMRPVSTEATATIKAAKGATYLSAFYSKNDASDVVVEFYNANRELVNRTLYAEGNKIEIPELPSLTGVGTSTGWTADGGETIIDTDAVITAEGSIMAFFAVYDEETIAKDISITASGSTGITGEGTYAFGDVVTLTAPVRENGNGYNMFLCWKKGDEIVSFDREYSFNAAVTCEVEAVYAKYGPTSVEALRKILVSTVGETVVAEFIGCGDALERGFIFGGTGIEDATYRQPMKTDSSSFTMENDTSLIARAYAIFTDGVIYSK